jgi:hypothetical protein
MMFAHRCQALYVDFADANIGARADQDLTPARLASLSRLQKDFTALEISWIRVIADPRMLTTRRQLAIEELERDAPNYAKMMTREQRARVLDHLKALDRPDATPSEKQLLARVTAAYSGPCLTLCSLGTRPQ